MKTKTWRERLETISYDVDDEDLKLEPVIAFSDAKQFISDLIAQTREETIVEIKEKLNKVIKYNSEISEDYQYAYSDLVEEINKLKK